MTRLGKFLESITNEEVIVYSKLLQGNEEELLMKYIADTLLTNYPSTLVKLTPSTNYKLELSLDSKRKSNSSWSKNDDLIIHLKSGTPVYAIINSNNSIDAIIPDSLYKKSINDSEFSRVRIFDIIKNKDVGILNNILRIASYDNGRDLVRELDKLCKRESINIKSSPSLIDKVKPVGNINNAKKLILDNLSHKNEVWVVHNNVILSYSIVRGSEFLFYQGDGKGISKRTIDDLVDTVIDSISSYDLKSIKIIDHDILSKSKLKS